MGKLYENALEAYENGESFKTLEHFYKIIGTVEPLLKTVPSKATDTRIAEAIEYIEQNYRSAMKIEDLAAHVNMSASRFFPKFKEQTGVTPIEYINRYRVNRAILLLISGDDLSIETVSEQSGFESSAYFRRTFKKITGISPRKYRDSAIEI
jgi:transcriptional regulator GlxA family with amidase domain